MIIDLLRHGETELGGGLRGSLDDSLTAKGWAQMQAAVASAGPWQALVSSPLQRCARFAEALSEQSQLPLQFAPGLQELHFGEWEGRSATELMLTHEQQLGQFWSDPYAFTPPGGEAVIDFSNRVLTAIADLNREHAGKHLLLVTHGGVMRLLLAQARGLPREQLLQVEVAHGALCRLEVLADGSLREVH